MRTGSITRRLIACTIFTVAMAYVTSTVVIYLRGLLDGGPHLFPLPSVPPKLLRIELAREVAEILMFAALAALLSRKPRVIAAFFVYCFGVWDIFYYVWLKLLIGWPPGLLTWDILFLVPLPWIGPVLSPIIVSLLFVSAALMVLRLEAAGNPVRFTRFDVLPGVAGALIVIGTYLWELPTVVRTGRPSVYPWWLFAIGIAFWTAAFVRRVIISNRANAA